MRGVETNSEAINEIITGVINYSSDETKCGTWNGKTLHRRILKLSEATDRKTYDLKSILGSATIVKTVAHTTQPNENFVPLPYYISEKDYAVYYINQSLLLIYRCGVSYGTGDMELEVYYTK